MWVNGVWGYGFRLGGFCGGVCFGFRFGLGGPVEGSHVFEAMWSGRKALCTKGAFVALSGERFGMLKLGSLRRYLGEFSPCVDIWILWF